MTQGQGQEARTAPQPRDPTPLDPTVAAPARRRAIRVSAGADVEDMELAGRTVADARAVAQALFGVHPNALAVVDGHRATDTHVLVEGQRLEFVKFAGQKGADGRASVIELADDCAIWRQNGREMGRARVHDLMRRVADAGRGPDAWRLTPPHVRLMVERAGGRLVGVVVEMAPGPRLVRWIAERSAADYGSGASYVTRELSFPWVVLVLVFGGGELTGFQQAFFRNAPLASLDDELFFTCLLNCADAPGYGHQASWVCLANLRRRLERLSWPERIQTVTEHFWHAAFNRSSEIHEGNSHWAESGTIDPRLATALAWEAATREDPYFTLGLPWRPAPLRLGATLAGMLDQLAPWQPVERVEQLVTLMQQEAP